MNSCNINDSDRRLIKQLRQAINNEDNKAVNRLIKGGVDVNMKFWVILFSYVFAVKLLLYFMKSLHMISSTF